MGGPAVVLLLTFFGEIDEVITAEKWPDQVDVMDSANNNKGTDHNQNATCSGRPAQS